MAAPGRFVICVFRPLPGKEDDLRAVLRDHLPTLRAEGLVTGRPPYVMKAKDGAYLEVFEWKSDEATAAAHENPRVRELWSRFEACSTYEKLETVAEIHEMFPHFDAVEPWPEGESSSRASAGLSAPAPTASSPTVRKRW